MVVRGEDDLWALRDFRMWMSQPHASAKSRAPELAYFMILSHFIVQTSQNQHSFELRFVPRCGVQETWMTIGKIGHRS